MWVRLDDNLHDDPTILELSDEAFRLFICGLTFCGGAMTDGHIPRRKALMLAPIDNPSEAVSELERAGLWIPTESGWEVDRWLEFNPSREKVEADREAAAERRRRWRDKKRAETESTIDDETRDATRDATRREASDGTRSERCPDPTRPDPTRPERVNDSLPAQTGDETIDEPAADRVRDEFEQTWKLYPRKTDKQAALRAYRTRIRNGADHQAIRAAVGHYRDSRAGEDPKFTKHGSTFFGPDEPWLEWVDGNPEPLARRATDRGGDAFDALDRAAADLTDAMRGGGSLSDAMNAITERST